MALYIQHLLRSRSTVPADQSELGDPTTSTDPRPARELYSAPSATNQVSFAAIPRTPRYACTTPGWKVLITS